MRGDVTLEEMLDRYLESRGGASPGYLLRMRYAIRWFRRAVGSGLACDLTELNLNRMITGANEAGMSAAYLDMLAERLVTLWRFASESALVKGPARRRRKELYHRDWRKPKGVRVPSRLRELPEAMPRLIETARATRDRRWAEPEIVLPTFDGASVSAEALATVEVKREKFSRYRKRW